MESVVNSRLFPTLTAGAFTPEDNLEFFTSVTSSAEGRCNTTGPERHEMRTWLVGLLATALLSACASPEKRDVVPAEQVATDERRAAPGPVAEEGDTEAQYGQGLVYWRGEGVSQDFTEAAKWFRRAAEQGAPHARP